ncbi:flagellar FliJ family protein [Leisingera sp. XS_AS12]|uniref:flagellar FliJ family protein n=1 Tax=Leisingera sp. XS_AS12 TaxID=3241294 RepID=UPI003518DDF2
MADRKKTYALLARLHKQEMEAQSVVLSSMQDEADRLTRERSALEESRRAGASVTMIEAMPYRGRFLNAVRQENQRLSGLIADVENKIGVQRDKVLNAYRELRSAEQLDGNIKAAQAEAEQEAAQVDADEMVLLRRPAAYL